MVTTLAAAQELIERQALQIEVLTQKLQGAELNLSRLQPQVEQLLRRIYGRRSEKMDPNQLLFDSLLLEADQSPASEPEPAGCHRTRASPRSGPGATIRAGSPSPIIWSAWRSSWICLKSKKSAPKAAALLSRSAGRSPRSWSIGRAS